MAESHIRIDEGITRKSRKDYRRDALKQPKSVKGTFLSTLDPETRKAIILEAPERILRGETTTQIAQSYGIPPSTIRSWLVGNNDAELARGAMLAMELMMQVEAIELAQDPLSLARAREAFRAWSWIAERREHRLYGQKQELTGKDGGPLQVQIVRFGETIEGQSSVVSDTPCTAPTPLIPLIPKP